MLEEIRDRLTGQLSGDSRLIEAERHLFSGNAKLMRPKLVMAFADLLRVDKNTVVDMACAVELIHTASLLHDDIIDRATTRRWMPSVNAQFGNGLAVLAGDRLLARALLLLSATRRAPGAVEVAARTVLTMADMAAKEVELHGKSTAEVELLVDIIDGKTGVLFGLCGRLAGLSAGSDVVATEMAHAGKLLGRVFQIKDDLDDIKQDRAQKILTLPIVIGESQAKLMADQYFTEAIEAMSSYKNHPKYADFEAFARILART